MVEVGRQKPDVKAVRLGTTDQGWETFLHFEAGGVGRKPERLKWPIQMVTPPQSKSLVLNATSSAHLDYALSPEAAGQVSAGDYSVIAVLEVPAAVTLPQDLWRGQVASRPVRLRVLQAPAQPSPAIQATVHMQRAEYFSTTGDWSNALASAQAALKADPKLIRAQMIVGEAKEAQDDLAAARNAFVIAKRLFDEQYPKSYETPRYLIYKIATLDERLPMRRSESTR